MRRRALLTMRLFALITLGALTVASTACYEQAPRWGPLAGIADSLLPRHSVNGCRAYGPESPGDPPVHACTGGETAVLVDRWGRVQRVIRHERPSAQSVLEHYQALRAQLAARLGPGRPVCFSANGRWPEGRQWQRAAYWAYVTPAVDTTEVELVWGLGTPQIANSCRSA
jgi:hypothetical protein